MSVLADGVFKAEKMIWGLSAPMQAVRRVVTEIAPKDIPILIVGESGTGKGLLALEIHRQSQHKQEPFIRVNCRSFDEGCAALGFRSASGGTEAGPSGTGTIFFENLSDLDLSGQRRMLDLLPDEDSFPDRVRSGNRVISAARRALDEDLRLGKFLDDLYFRLNGVCFHMPPLRERKEDIPEIADRFIQKYAALFGRPNLNLSEEVLARMASYSWPGNIRQLENTVKRIVATGDVRGAFDDLIELARATSVTPGPLKRAVREVRLEVERELIARALTKNRWNRKRAAQELQISYKSLLSKLKRIGAND